VPALNVPTLALVHHVGALALRILEICAVAVAADTVKANKLRTRIRFIHSPLIVLRLSLGVR
jgi:hypothetical protein